MDKDEALKQALEALEGLFGLPDKFTGGGGDVAVWRLGGSYRAQEAIASLRQAIAELESQEPVAWRWETHNGYAYSEQHYEGENGQPLYTHPPQRTEQEPVAFASHGVINWIADKQFQHEADLYTTPPQRKPLTNGEIYTAYITATNQTLRAQDERLAFAFARAIEAAHGIKENT
jgi:hypothetical protein